MIGCKGLEPDVDGGLFDWRDTLFPGDAHDLVANIDLAGLDVGDGHVWCVGLVVKELSTAVNAVFEGHSDGLVVSRSEGFDDWEGVVFSLLEKH